MTEEEMDFAQSVGYRIIIIYHVYCVNSDPVLYSSKYMDYINYIVNRSLFIWWEQLFYKFHKNHVTAECKNIWIFEDIGNIFLVNFNNFWQK